MATISTGWKCTHTATVTAQTATTATIRVTCYWQNDGWRYDISHVHAWVYCNGIEAKVMDSGSIDTSSSVSANQSCGYYDFTIDKTTAAQSISCYAKIQSKGSYVQGTKNSTAASVSVAAKNSYTISYNANGGTGAPAAQTKWHGTNLALSTAKPTRTGYTFAGWATSASGAVAYQPGGTYSANAAATLYAKWTANTYTVSYNANGGTGAPAAQTKTYGVNLTLSSTKPTRTNYNFLGWATSASATTAQYAAGGSYTTNNAVTLYAVWELAYAKPRITNVNVYRCTADGTVSDNGTYYKASFDWATDQAVTAISVSHVLQSGEPPIEPPWSETISDIAAAPRSVWQVTSGVPALANSNSEISVGVTTANSYVCTDRESKPIYAMPVNAKACEVSVRNADGSSNTYCYIGLKKNGSTLTTVFNSGKIAKSTYAWTAGAIDYILISMEHTDYSSYAWGYNDSNISVTFTGGVTENDDGGSISIPASGTSGSVETGVLGGALSVYCTYSITISVTDKETTSLPRTLASKKYSIDTAYNPETNEVGVAVGKSCEKLGVFEIDLDTLVNGAINGIASVNQFGWWRMNNGWLGMYGSAQNAFDNVTRKGWLGYDNDQTLYIYDEVGGRIELVSKPGAIYFYPNYGNGGNSIVIAKDRLRTQGNDVSYLGDSSNKWKAVYAVNGTIQTSDRSQKKDIAEIDQRYIELFDRLLPVSFMFNDPESDRTHIGFISQDVEAAMKEVGLTDLDFAGFCRDVKTEWDEEAQEDKPVLDENGNSVYIYSLRYTEFVALNSRMIQLNREAIKAQQAEIDTLKAEMAELKAMIFGITRKE